MKQVTEDVKKYFPRTNLKRDCWVYRTGPQSWEFHGPDEFYWQGHADNAYEAKARGWTAWLQKMGKGEKF
jgi:hypothetical protein